VESVSVLRYKQGMVSTADSESETGSGEEQARGGTAGRTGKRKVLRHSRLCNAIGPGFSAFGLSIIWITPCLFCLGLTRQQAALKQLQAPFPHMIQQHNEVAYTKCSAYQVSPLSDSGSAEVL
jgi:hypothetical protein